MAEIHFSDLDYLARYGISEDDVFDATGLELLECRKIMKSTQLIVKIGAQKCPKHRATIRTIDGDCMHCFPSAIRYYKKHMKLSGDVYIAYSEMLQRTKIGSTSGDPYKQMEHLNNYEYGGSHDWRCYYFIKADKPVVLEIATKRRLIALGVVTHLVRRPDQSISRELFRCRPFIANKHLVTARKRLMTAKKQPKY